MTIQKIIILYIACAGFISVQPLHAITRTAPRKVHTQRHVESPTIDHPTPAIEQTTFIEKMAQPAILGLSIGVGLGITLATIAYLNKTALEAGSTQVVSKAIQNNAHLLSCNIFIKGEDTPLWVKGLLPLLAPAINSLFPNAKIRNEQV